MNESLVTVRQLLGMGLLAHEVLGGETGLDRPVQHVRVRSASATGAAVLAARGVGLELVPRRAPEPVVAPHAVPGAAAVRERWAAAVHRAERAVHGEYRHRRRLAYPEYTRDEEHL